MEHNPPDSLKIEVFTVEVDTLKQPYIHQTHH